MSQGLEFEVGDRLSPAQVEDLLRLYGNEWWSAQRTRPDVERMLEASGVFRGPAEGETLVAWMSENEDAWRQTLST